MKLQRLYKTAKSGATQIFDIEVWVPSDDAFTVTWGQLGGKMQTKVTKCTPKNVGRSNETTEGAQALLEAEAVWTKKQKANYSTSPAAPTTVNLPMKVNSYHDFKHKIIFPCFVSPKLNGVNVEYRLVEGELKLLSRGGEEYPVPEHQREEAITLIKALDGMPINGEMYYHGEHLQDIMAATKKHNELTPKLMFHIFDFPTAEGTYEERCSALYPKVAGLRLKTIVTINVGVAHDHEDIMEQHDAVVMAGYEGIVVRNRAARYEYNTRSLDVFKCKLTQDAEFEVRSFDLDKSGHAVYTCTTGEVDFKVKRKGTNEERTKDAANAITNIGKYLNVQYEMLSKDGVPLKPVGQHFRKCDSQGKPLE